ncbi:MAG: DsbA family protein [Parvibaculum sp.]
MSLVVGLIGSFQQAAAADFSSSQKSAIEKIIHDYLVKNPEVLVEAMSELDAKQAAANKKKQNDAITKYRDQIFNDPSSYVAGNPEGDVTIVEFFDYNCGYCKRAFAPLMNTLKDDGNVRLILKEFPILGPTSIIATRATMAAKKQGKYFDMHKALYLHKGSLDEASIMDLARAIGIDMAKLRKDMKDPAIQKTIDRDEELASALGITGTPSFIIGGQPHPGAMSEDELKAAIKAARKG